MTGTRRLHFSLLILAVVVVVAPMISSRESSKASVQKKSSIAPVNDQDQIARGRYLVEDVAMCQECHTPRNASGNLDKTRWLQGAPIWIMPVHPDTTWAMRAPAIAGFTNFSDEQGEDILERGIGPNGLAIQPPMHIYHMNHADATAIIAYLRSLPASYPQE